MEGSGSGLEDGGGCDSDQRLITGFAGGQDESQGEGETREVFVFFPGVPKEGDGGVTKSGEGVFRQAILFSGSGDPGEGSAQDEVLVGLPSRS